MKLQSHPQDPKPSPENHFCAQPWVGLQVRPNKGLRPCCMFPYDVSNLSSPESLQNYFSSPQLSDLRNKMLNGQRPSECQSCQLEETLTGTSPRLFSPGFSQGFQAHQLDFTINRLELFVSNLCNLDCVMCNPTFSSKWNSLSQELEKQGLNFLNYQQAAVEKIDLAQIDSLFSRAKTAKEVLLLGGEPLASSEILIFLNRWVQEECLGELTLITNGTLLTEPLIDLLSRCKNLFLILSIDAAGPLYEWIRGSSWVAVAEKIALAHQKIRNLTLSPTIAAYNLFNLEELYHFGQSTGVRVKFDHILSQPSFLRLGLYPAPIRRSLQRKLNSLNPELFKSLSQALLLETAPARPDEIIRFQQWCAFFNKKRGLDLFDLCPELKPALDAPPL